MRGGSKGLPGKNICKLKGKPLIAYTIEAAIASLEVTRVVVTTDSKSIANVATAYGAEVPFMRPSELATDASKAIDVYKHVLDNVFQKNNDRYDEFVVLLPTCPLRMSSDIDSAINLYKQRNASSVVSYTIEDHPVRWHRYLTDDGKFVPVFEETIDNRQSEVPSYYPNGAIYVFNSELLQKGTYYDDHSFAYVMPRERSVDIDTLHDLKYAEFLMGH